MSDIILRDADQVQALVRPLVGLTVSLPRKGYGPIIFLELGSLAPPEPPLQYHQQGEACISFEWDWRIEAEGKILYGSANSRPEIATRILSLQGTTIRELLVAGQVPELIIQFSNGHCLRSMAMKTGDPEWAIKLPDERWVYARSGSIRIGTGYETTSDEELASLYRAERTADRWGVPCAEPRLGSCAQCAFFVPLDGDGPMLDYGSCTAESGPFDGRIVAKRSGCPAFVLEES
jgi:hypothetical protein